MTPITFQQLATQWKAEKRQYVKKSSYAAYIQHLNTHLLPAFAGHLSIDPDEIQSLVDRLLAKGLSPKTVKDALLVLRMILRFAERRGLWPHVETCVHYPTTTAQQKALPVLSLPQQKRLTAYLKANFSFRNLGILICLHTCLRIGEICALQWKDLDMAAGVLHVGKTLSRIYLSDGGEQEYYLSIGTPKTVSSVRDIPITQPLATTIRALLRIVNPDYFVVSNAAAPLEPRYYRDYFLRVLNHLGIPPVRFHALRHSFATRCIESKCDYKTVSVILGHASISTTLDLYVHPGIDDKRRCIERMSRALAQ